MVSKFSNFIKKIACKLDTNDRNILNSALEDIKELALIKAKKEISKKPKIKKAIEKIKEVSTILTGEENEKNIQ